MDIWQQIRQRQVELRRVQVVLRRVAGGKPRQLRAEGRVIRQVREELRVPLDELHQTLATMRSRDLEHLEVLAAERHLADPKLFFQERVALKLEPHRQGQTTDPTRLVQRV